MAEAAISKGAEITVELVVDSISTQLGYIRNCKTNFEDLERQHQKLEGTRDRVQHSVDEALRNGEEIEQNVENWLERVEKINAEVTKIIEDYKEAYMRCCKSLCPDLKKRYQHSKKAVVLGMEVSKLETEGKFDKVSYCNPPKETWHPSNKLYQDIESRRSTVENILNALRNPDINMVGVHGMGGIGKTMLAKEVGKQAEEQRLFDALVFVEISEKPDIRKIQGAIAYKLGLEFREETESGRARALCQRCKKESKLLIILDNIWKGLDLERVGIPFANNHPGCKLLLTARSIDVLSNDMNSLKNFAVGKLDEKEAWNLFKTAAGACIEQHNLQSLAFEVAKRCGGLPIAIVTIAKALKDKQEHEWKNAFRELQRLSSDNLVGSVTAEAYSCIQFSYYQLNTDELKSTFLLCCTMAFTSNASFEELLRYGMGLSLFRTVYSMEEARDRVNTLLKKLKDSSLLLDTPDGEGFSIHDVVCDVGRAIAINDHNMYTVNDDRILQQDLAGKNRLKNCTYIILHDIAELPEVLDCSQLEFLYVKPKTRFSKIPDNFFKGMPNLGVLHLIEMVLSPLPASFHLLKKLQTLYLDRCHLRDIAEIGNLKNLKILVLSTDIERLPEQLGELTRLKVLDLSKCSNLEVIPPNTISRLTQLEELYMPYWFDQWHVEGVEGERSNGSLGEIEHLSQLTALQIYIPDAKLVPKGLVFQKLQRYTIYIGAEGWSCYSGHNTSRLLKLKYDDANISVEDGIMKQLKEIEEMELTGKQGVKNVLYELNRDGFPKLKHFYVRSNPELVYIVDFPKQSEPSPPTLYTVAFPHLQTLSLFYLSSLEKICHGQFTLTPNSFRQLRTIQVQFCVKLKNIFSSSIARHLSQLQQITVSYCENMEEIFSIGSENEEIVLKKLDSLYLYKLPKLRSFSYEEEVSSTSDQERQMKDTLMPLFDGKVIFRNLKTMELWKIDLKYVFSSSTIGSFVQLQHVNIRKCRILEEIIRIDDLKNNAELPSLKNLKIEECPAMKSFICSDKVTFPSLEEIEISDMDNLEMIWHNQLEDSQNVQNCQKLCKVKVTNCQSLKHLFSASVVKNLLQLKDIYVEECGIKEIIAKEEGGDRMFVFPELTSLSLHNLQELKCFYPGIYTTKWPMLKKLNVIGCDKIDASELFNIKEVILEDQPDFIAQEKVVFPNLEALKLSAVCVETIWHNQIPETYNQNLTCLIVQGCGNLRHLFSSSIVNSFVKLQCLKICECTALENIIVEEALREEFHSGNHIEFPSLKELEIENCPKFKTFIFNNKVGFPSLEKMKISCMDNLEAIWHDQLVEDSFWKLKSLEVNDCQKLSTVFPWCICAGLLRLESLIVKCCGSVKEIYDLQGLNFEEQQEITSFHLTELYIDYLPNLKYIWNKDPQGLLSLQNLKKVTIFLCWSLKYLFPASVARSLLQLESLMVSDCGVEEIVAKEVVEESAARFVFPFIRSLQLYRLPELITFYPGLHTLECPVLERLGLHYCDKLKRFISEFLSLCDTNEPFFLLRKLYFSNLKKLELSGEATMLILQNQVPEDLFYTLKILELTDTDSKTTVLPLGIQEFHNLEKLSLNSGSYIEIFSYEEVKKHAQMLPSINHLALNGLFDLKQIWKHDSSEMDLNFQNLETLEVRSCTNLISLMPSSASFQNLRILEVWGCEGLKNLLTSSTAKSLAQLEKLEVFDCKMMIEVVANEGAMTDKIIFSKLKSLSLMYLQNLSSFCSVKHILNFPILESLVVNECPKMRSFSKGVTITPSLRKLELNWKAIEHSQEVDLNTNIQRDMEEGLPGREDSSDPSFD